jgi:anti-anti-sigma factor
VTDAERLALGSDALILHLSEVAFIDSIGLRPTIEATKRAQADDRPFAIVTPGPPVDRGFALTRMYERLSLAETPEGALERTRA